MYILAGQTHSGIRQILHKKNPQARYESVCKNSICVEQRGFVNAEERHSLDGRKDGVILCQKHKRILFEAKEFHLLWRRGAGTERALHVNREHSKCKITNIVHQGALKSTLHIRLEWKNIFLLKNTAQVLQVHHYTYLVCETRLCTDLGIYMWSHNNTSIIHMTLCQL